MPPHDLRQKFLQYKNALSIETLMENTCKLAALERPQDSRAQKKSALFAAKLLEEAGGEKVEILLPPADGKTCFMDKTMPMGWEAESGRLTLLSGPEGTIKGEVIADYSQHPFHLVHGSISTPPGGVDAPLILEKDFHKGADVKGAFVLLEESTWPRRDILSPVLDKGGLGLVSSFLTGGDVTPDSFQWVVASTEGRQWHIVDTDREFISWSISPALGRKLRALGEKGPLMVHAECNARRCVSEVPIVTGLLPGKKPEEVWLIAHLYEPLIEDNSSGVASIVETIRLLKAQGQPEYTVRAIFAMEMYGFAAYAARFELPLRKKVLGGCNFDGIYHTDMSLVPSGTGNPFYGNAIMRLFLEENKEETTPRLRMHNAGKYYDDIHLSDPTVGVNLFWPLHYKPPYWHNSFQDENYLQKDLYRGCVSVDIALSDALANPDMTMAEKAVEVLTKDLAAYAEKAKEFPSPRGYFRRRAQNALDSLRDFARPLGKAPDTAGFEAEADRLAALLPEGKVTLPGGPVYRRKEPGFPNDLRKFPLEKRKMDADFIYGSFSHILANMDGKTSMEELIERASYEEEVVRFTPEEIRHFYFVAGELAEYGYLEKV